MHRPRALSLVEVLIGLAFFALIAAITLPRLSRADVGRDPAEELRTKLQVLRVAIERYYQDHGTYPARTSDGPHAPGTPETFASQLTEYSNAAGRTSTSRTAEFCYGPYLRDGMPTSPVADDPSATRVLLMNVTPLMPDEASRACADVGWLYNFATGQVSANSADADAEGRSYASY